MSRHPANSGWRPCAQGWLILPDQAMVQNCFQDHGLWVANYIAQVKTGNLVVFSREEQAELAVALALEAVRQGCRTLLSGLQGLIGCLAKADSQNRLEEKLRFLCQPKMMIIEDTGYPDQYNADLLCQLIAHRSNKSTLILTVGQPAHYWREFFDG